jgi:hypothetical protein
MSETQTTETLPVDEGEKEPAWYRDQISKKDTELKEAQKTINRQKVKLMESTFEQVGLDPTKGLGKAIAEKYDGEPDAETLRAFAIDEYSWEPPTTPQQEVVGAINEAQARVNQAQRQASSVDSSAVDVEIAEAESSGNFAAAMQLKVQKFRETQGI